MSWISSYQIPRGSEASIILPADGRPGPGHDGFAVSEMISACKVEQATSGWELLPCPQQPIVPIHVFSSWNQHMGRPTSTEPESVALTC